MRKGRAVKLGEGYLGFDSAYEGENYTCGLMEYSDPDGILKSDFKTLRGSRLEFKRVALYAVLLPKKGGKK